VIVRIITYERSTLVNDEKYIGLDVHQATISVAVMNATGKVVMESILETKAATILEFFAGLRGTLQVTFEEGTWSVWLYDLLNPRVDKLIRNYVVIEAFRSTNSLRERQRAEMQRPANSEEK
jgi:hypothetical protein